MSTSNNVMRNRKGGWFTKRPTYEENWSAYMDYSLDLSLIGSSLRPTENVVVENQPEWKLFLLCCGGEARGEPPEGITAVASVIMNRAERGGYFGENVRDVIIRRNATGAIYQFESMHPKNPNRKWMEKPDPVSLLKVAKAALPVYLGQTRTLPADIRHFLHKNLKIPSWAAAMSTYAIIGNHRFLQS